MVPFGRYALWLALALVMMVAPPAMAQTCGETYQVRPGDTLGEISRRAYGNQRRWSVIYNSNRKIIGNSPTFIFPGQRLSIPCSQKAKKALKAKPVSPAPEAASTLPAVAAPDTASTFMTVSKELRLLTADDYQPFTDRALPGGGMITDLISTALAGQKEQADGPAHKIYWVNDWSAHLNPLLVNRAFDMGFPWFQPNCERYDELDEPARFRCDRLHFSKPVFEILVLFFAKKGSNFQYADDADVVGKRLCRPSGYFTFDLDDNNRNWVKDEKVTLLRPQTVEECFKLLDRDEVDAVVINEFTGRAAVLKAQMSDRVNIIEKPVSLQSLHVVIAKSHPEAQQYLAQINQALDRIRQSGAYSQIIENHLSVFWKTQGSS